MTTLKELGFIPTGNYLNGDRNGVCLNLKGAAALNELFPSASVPNFQPGDAIEFRGKLPKQEGGDLKVLMIAKGAPLLVSLANDDWFNPIS